MHFLAVFIEKAFGREKDTIQHLKTAPPEAKN